MKKRFLSTVSMKKFLSMVMVVSILLGIFSVSANADSSAQFLTTTADNITEYTDSSNRVIRTYTKGTNTMATMNDVESTMLGLGMTEREIQRLTLEEKEVFANSSSIFSISSYIKTEEDGISYLVSEDVAMKESAEQQKQVRETYEELLSRAASNDPYEDYDSYEDFDVSDMYPTNTYINIWVGVAHMGGRTYLFTINTRWLSMPYERKTDAVGVISQEISVNPDSWYGYYEFKTEYSGTSGSIPSYEEFFDSDVSNVNNGTFSGCGVDFELPKDALQSGITGSYVIQSDFYVHFSFTADIRDYLFPKVFSVIGSYVHTTTNMSGEATLGISVGADMEQIGLSVDATIGFANDVKQESRSVLLQLDYPGM